MRTHLAAYLHSIDENDVVTFAALRQFFPGCVRLFLLALFRVQITADKPARDLGSHSTIKNNDSWATPTGSVSSYSVHNKISY